MAREWYRFFLNLFVNTGGASALNLQALQLAPPSFDTSAALETLAAAAQTQPVNNEELLALANSLQALAVAPAPQPEVQQLHYGVFYDMTDQSVGLINTATAITFNSEDGAFGVRRGVTTSQIFVDNPGFYNFQFSAQIDNTSGGDVLIYIWADINGTAVPNTMSRWRVKGNDAEIVPALNFVLQMKAGDYFRLMWASDNVNAILDTFAATAFGPATPSVILTVTQVNL